MLLLLVLLLSLVTTSVANDNRLIAYVAPWEACPSIEKLSYYTHVVLSTTEETCEQAACSPQWIQQLHSAGVYVLLGVNHESCMHEAKIMDVVTTQGLDGVVLGRPDDVLPEQVNVVSEALRIHESLIVAHQVTDTQVMNGWYQPLKSMDFVIVEYFNGVTRPGVDGWQPAGLGDYAVSEVYQHLVDQLLDATKHVFGFCIHDCSYTASNVAGVKAVEILKEASPLCHGGVAAQWAHRDLGWSEAVSSQVLELDRGCSGDFTKVQPHPCELDCTVSFLSGRNTLDGYTVKRVDIHGECEEACTVSLSWYARRGYECDHCP